MYQDLRDWAEGQHEPSTQSPQRRRPAEDFLSRHTLLIIRRQAAVAACEVSGLGMPSPGILHHLRGVEAEIEALTEELRQALR